MPATSQSSLDLPATANPVAIDGVLRVFEPDPPAARPVILASPHSGRDYREDMQAETLLTLAQLRRSEDAYVDEIVENSTEYGASLLLCDCPRVFVDVNRGPGELDSGMFADRLPEHAHERTRRAASGLGVIPRIGADGRSLYRRKFRFAEAEERLERYYAPYHRALSDLIARRREQFGFAVLLDMHSMPNHSARGADIVLGDRFGRSCAAPVVDVAERLFQDAGFVTVRNTPYAGGFTTEHYGAPDNGVHVLQIEINRSLYMDESRVVRRRSFAEFSTSIRNIISDFARNDWHLARAS